jgi:hypothetical protein
MFAAKGGHTDIARLLVEHKANVDIKNPSGTQPEIESALHGHRCCLNPLVDLSIHSSIYQRIYTSLSQSFYQCMCLAIHLSISISIYSSIDLYLYLYVSAIYVSVLNPSTCLFS